MSISEANQVYEAIQQERPVYPTKISLGLDRTRQLLSETSNPYAAALKRDIDSEFQEEPMSGLYETDLSWSILTTQVKYVKENDKSWFKPMNDSPLFQGFTEMNFTDAECVEDVSEEQFEEVSCELNESLNFDEHVDVTTTYLGRYMAQGGPRMFNSENVISLDGKGVTAGHLFDKTELKVFFDSGASKSYMSKGFYEKTEYLHRIPKMKSSCTGIKIGNGAVIPVDFVFPVQIMIQGHLFEIYTIVAALHESIDVVIGMKNMVELEGILNTRTSSFDFLSRSIPIYPQNDLKVKPGGKAYIKIVAPFQKQINTRAIAKFFACDRIFTFRMRFKHNRTVIEFENKGDKISELFKDRPIGILDLRSIGYYKVSYQRLVSMAEEKFQMFHYAKTPKKGDSIDRYNRMSSEHRRDVHRSDPYPWLAPDDPRRFQTDNQILYEKIDLSESDLTSKEKTKLMKLVVKYRDAFSLRDEIGACPNLTADIQVIDESSFFVRPFPLSEPDKVFMDDQMERLVSLGILSKNSTSHTSPVMLITRKLTNDKRPVVDFRLLNTRILRRNTSIPLMKDVLSILGNSKCEVMSCVDIKDAYHSIPLTEKSKEYCGILPYFGSPIYRYEVLPMGIACAPQIWMDYITLILSELEHKTKYIAIMDDLLVHSTKAEHWLLIEQLFQSMVKNGLRLSPKKCQFFKTNLVYMGNEFVISQKNITVTPLRSRTEAIVRIPTPRTPRQCKSFCGVVNYLALFCPDLQTLLETHNSAHKERNTLSMGKRTGRSVPRSET